MVRHRAGVVAEQWTDFTQHIALCGGGVLAVRAETGHIHGIAAYLPVKSLRLGPALHVEVFVAFELGPSSAVRSKLLSALEEVAKNMNCPTVTLNFDVRGLVNKTKAKLQDWQNSGLVPDSVEFVLLKGAAGPGSSSDQEPDREDHAENGDDQPDDRPAVALSFVRGSRVDRRVRG